MSVTIIDRVDDFRSVRDEWCALSDRASTGCLFNSFHWLDAWWDAFADEHWKMQVACVRDAGGRLVGALPLMRVGAGIAEKRRLKSIFNHQSIRTDVLIDPDHPTALQELLTFLASEHSRWDVAELVGVPEDSPLFGSIGSSAIEPLHVRAVRTSESPYLDLQGRTFREYYEDRFSAEERRLDSWALEQVVGKLDGRIDVIRNSSKLHSQVDAGLEIEALDRKRENGSSMNQDPRVRAFMHDVAERAASEGTLMIILLAIAARPAAFLLGIEHRGTFNVLKTSDDPELATLGLGRIVINRALQEAFERRLKRFDFLGSADDYELRYTDQKRAHSTMFLYNSGVLSQLRRAFQRSVIPLARQILGRENRYPALLDR